MKSLLLDVMKERVVVIDGAMGTSIHSKDLDLERDYSGLENCCEILNLNRPDVIEEIHGSFFEAGCDAVLVCKELDLCLEAHAALTRRAETEPAFLELLRVAATRALSARRRFALAPCAPEDAASTLQGFDPGALEARFA